MAISCSTSAFKVPLNVALDNVVSLGFSHTDVICIPSWGHVVPADLVENFDAAAGEVESLLAERSLTATALNCAFGAHPYQRDDPDANAQRLAELDAVCRLATRLGAKVCSFYPGYKEHGTEAGDMIARTAETCREMLGVAAARGVTVAPEPHYATPLEDPAAVAELLEAVPELEVVYDPSHWAMQEMALTRTEFMLDRTVHVHLRDAAPGKMQEVFGDGTVDFEALIGALRSRGYAGHYAIEYLPKLEGGETAEQITALRDRIAPLIAD